MAPFFTAFVVYFGFRERNTAFHSAAERKVEKQTKRLDLKNKKFSALVVEEGRRIFKVVLFHEHRGSSE